MAKDTDKTSGGHPADPADFSRIAADAMKDMPLHPLLTHPTAALAAATAIGLGLATQMTGAFLGSLQGMMEASNQLARKQEEDEAAKAEAPSAEPAAKAAVPAKSTKAAKAKAPAAKATKAPAKKAAPKAEAAPVVKSAAAKPAKTTDKAKPVEAKPAPKAAAKSKAAAAPKKASAKAARPDDLKKISGIGPKLEQVLNGMGVTRFADIAGWSSADIARIDEELGFGGRVGRDDWVGQAKALMGGKG